MSGWGRRASAWPDASDKLILAINKWNKIFTTVSSHLLTSYEIARVIMYRLAYSFHVFY